MIILLFLLTLAIGLVAQWHFIHLGHESAAVRPVLNGAAWTYEAAFISSLICFLWHLLLAADRRETAGLNACHRQPQTLE